MTPAGGATRVREVVPPPPAQVTVQGSLLPEGRPLSAATMNDAMSGLCVVLSQLRESSLALSKGRIEDSQRLREKELADQLADIQRQEDAHKGGGFWHDLENVALTVAKVALVVASV